MTIALHREHNRSLDFATALAHGVADLAPEDLAHDALVLTFGLSAWMRGCSVGMDEAWGACLALRSALIEAGGLGRSIEPVPLRTADARTALVSMVVYLDGLVQRAASASRQRRWEIVTDAVERMAALGAPAA